MPINLDVNLKSVTGKDAGEGAYVEVGRTRLGAATDPANQAGPAFTLTAGRERITLVNGRAVIANLTVGSHHIWIRSNGWNGDYPMYIPEGDGTITLTQAIAGFMDHTPDVVSKVHDAASRVVLANDSIAESLIANQATAQFVQQASVEVQAYYDAAQTQSTDLADVTEIVDANVKSKGLVSTLDPRVPREAPEEIWAEVVVDSNDRMAYGVKQDGTVSIPKLETESLDIPAPPKPHDVLQDRESTGPVFAITDSQNRVALSIEPDGTVKIPKLAASSPSAATRTQSRRLRVACWGDSYTDGGPVPGGLTSSWPTFLNAAIPANVVNCGVGGQTSGTIAIRQGGLAVSVTLPSGIPSGTSATSGTFSLATPTIAQSLTVVGSLQGIPGTLNLAEADLNGNGTCTFTRSQAGTSIACNNALFTPDQGRTERESTCVLWFGKNDQAINPAAMQLSLERSIDAMISYLTPDSKHFLVLSVATLTSETTGTSGHNLTTSVNSALAARYGSNFFDIRAALIQEGLQLAGLTPTAADLSDIAGDTIPRQLRMADGSHFTAQAYEYAIGPLIERELDLRGWI